MKQYTIANNYGRFFRRTNSSLIQKRWKGEIHDREKHKFQRIRRDETEINHIRNIGIMAHIDAGKTTTTERFLYYTGYTRHLGDVNSGDTVTDYMDQERERGITITSAAISFFWNKHRINLIDTPGHVDFTLEVERSLRVLDGAVAVMDASRGVEAQTLTVWRQADRYHVPRLIYLNKMDKANANFDDSIDSIEEKLHIKPLITQLPLMNNDKFSGVVDIMTMRKFIWHSDDPEGTGYDAVPLHLSKDASLYEEAYATRSALIEKLADIDETLASQVLNDVKYENISALDLTRALRKATIYHHQVPLLCGSSFKNKGVQPLLNSIINLLPNPTEREHKFLNYYQNTLCALAFKIVPNKQHGHVTFIRLYSGSIYAGSTIYNINRGCKETVQKLFHVYADEYQPVIEAHEGNIVAVTGLDETVTGDTLVVNLSDANRATKAWKQDQQKEDQTINHLKPAHDPLDDYDDDAEDYDFEDDWEDETQQKIDAPVLAGLKIPDPVFMCTVEAPTLSKQKILEEALARLTREDPSLRVETDADTGQIILAGMGELHLEVIKERIRNEYKVEVNLGPLSISYREQLQAPVQESFALSREIGRKQHEVKMKLTLLPSDEMKSEQKLVKINLDKECEIVPNQIKIKTSRAIMNGVQSALNRGPLLACPIMNVGVELNDFSIRYGTSPAIIRACAAQCAALALKQASTRLLQPMMHLEIHTDEEHLNIVTTEITRRHGILEDIGAKRTLRVVNASTPLANIMDFSSTLRKITSGTAGFSMELSHYEPMTQRDTDDVIQKVTGFRPIRE